MSIISTSVGYALPQSRPPVVEPDQAMTMSAGVLTLDFSDLDAIIAWRLRLGGVEDELLEPRRASCWKRGDFELRGTLGNKTQQEEEVLETPTSFELLAKIEQRS